MIVQVPGHPHQIGLDALCTDRIEALEDHSQSIVNLGPLGSPALLLPFFTDQIPFQQAD